MIDMSIKSFKTIHSRLSAAKADLACCYAG